LGRLVGRLVWGGDIAPYPVAAAGFRASSAARSGPMLFFDARLAA
jgi:hypothetical protein